MRHPHARYRCLHCHQSRQAGRRPWPPASALVCGVRLPAAVCAGGAAHHSNNLAAARAGGHALTALP